VRHSAALLPAYVRRRRDPVALAVAFDGKQVRVRAAAPTA
jgi:hypothetical protein